MRRLYAVQQMLADEFEKNKYLVVEVKTKPKTKSQNAFQFVIYQELERQGDCSAAYYRNYCKYHFGLPILKVADETASEFVEKALDSLDYEQRIQAMNYIDVTKKFKANHMKSYLNSIFEHFNELGFSFDDNNNKNKTMR